MNSGLRGGFSDDPRSVLGEILALALVRLKLLFNGAFRKPTIAAGELHVAVFTDAEQGTFTHDPQSSLRHSVKFLAEDFLFCSLLAKLGVLFSNLASMAKSFLNLLVHLSEGTLGLLVFHSADFTPFTHPFKGLWKSNCTTTAKVEA
jgi:hypothetical protein